MFDSITRLITGWEEVQHIPEWIDLLRAEKQIPIGSTKTIHGHHYEYRLQHTMSDNGSHGVEVTGRRRI